MAMNISTNHNCYTCDGLYNREPGWYYGHNRPHRVRCDFNFWKSYCSRALDCCVKTVTYSKCTLYYYFGSNAWLLGRVGGSCAGCLLLGGIHSCGLVTSISRGSLPCSKPPSLSFLYVHHFWPHMQQDGYILRWVCNEVVIY